MAAQVTAFTPPANCASHWTYEPSATDGNDFRGGLLLQRAQGPPSAPSEALDPTCWPDVGEAWGRWPGFTTVFASAQCPSGYTAALQSNGATTTETCCLSGFDYTSTVGTLNGGTDDVVFYGCTSMYSANYDPTSVFAITPYGTLGELDGTQGSVTVVSGPITMWAQPITVAYQERDIPTTVPSPAMMILPSESNTSSPSPTAAPLTAVVSPSTTSTPQPSPSLSTGSIAGITIGVVAFFGLLLIGALFLLRRKKLKRHAPSMTPSSFLTPSSLSSAKFEAYRGSSQAELETSMVQQHGNHDTWKFPVESRLELRTPSPYSHHRSGTDSPWLMSD